MSLKTISGTHGKIFFPVKSDPMPAPSGPPLGPTHYPQLDPRGSGPRSTEWLLWCQNGHSRIPIRVFRDPDHHGPSTGHIADFRYGRRSGPKLPPDRSGVPSGLLRATAAPYTRNCRGYHLARGRISPIFDPRAGQRGRGPGLPAAQYRPDQAEK